MEQDFDKYASDYRSIHTENVKSISGADSYYFAEYKVKELCRYEMNARISILDLGCGDGATEFFIQKYLPSAHVVGIDVSDKSLKIAEQRELKNVSFLHYNGGVIPFENNSFDVVFVAGVLHHVHADKQIQLIREVFRVLKTQGRLYLFEHNPLNPFTKFLVRTCVFDQGVVLLKSNEAKKLISDAGFKNTVLKFTIFFPRITIFKPFINLERHLQKIPLGGQYYIRAIKH